MDEPDLDRERERLTKLAGDDALDVSAAAMFELGDLELESRNGAEADGWFRLAVKSGHREHGPAAAMRLGRRGRWKRDNLDDPRGWLDQAIESGHSEHAANALLRRGMLEARERNMEEAAGWFLRAVETGHDEYAPHAMTWMATVARWRQRVSPAQQNLDEARTWSRRAIETGHPRYSYDGMVTLGDVLLDEHDFDGGLALYRQAAESDDIFVRSTVRKRLALFDEEP